MKVLIGMLIHNEEDIIANTLATVFKQNIFNDNNIFIEMIIIANACTDNSAVIASEHLRQFKHITSNFDFTVISKDEPGKIAAWNDLIHLYSKADDDYIICMDGDILIQEDSNFRLLVQALEDQKSALISTDLPIKDISLNNKKNLRSKVSLAFSKITRKGNSQLCGQLYCARSSFLRQLYIPAEVLIDDTYIKFMACTNGLSTDVDNTKIINIHSISHVFEAYTGTKDYFNNQIRQTVGFSLWRIFKEIIKKDMKDQNAIEAVRKRAIQNPDWLRDEMILYFMSGKKWHIYQGALSVRFKRLKRLSRIGQIKMFLPVTAAWIIDLVVMIISNHKIQNKHLEKLWADTKSKKISQSINTSKLLKTRVYQNNI